MVSFWRSLKKQAPQPYRLARLVDVRSREEARLGGLQIVCDIDKTYLETEFESLLRMARIAFEAAVDKVTVTGASEVLLCARWGDINAPLPPAGDLAAVPHPLHFVSSSPPQLRGVLEEKMALDGLDWSSDTFKNQAYNLRMGRMDLLRQHVAYKSLAILNLVAAAGEGARFLLIGDNAETDAYIYTGLRLLLGGHLTPAGYQGYLEAAGVETAVARDLVDVSGGLNARAAAPARIAAILIRNVPGYTFVTAPSLTAPVQTFDNFFQAALLLMGHGFIPASRLWALTRSFHNHHGMTKRELGSMLRAVVTAALPVDRADLAAAALSALAQLGREAEAAEPHAALTQSLAGGAVAPQAPGEAQILADARVWMQRLHAQTGKA